MANLITFPITLMPHANLTVPILLSIVQISGLMFIGAVGRHRGYIDERDIDRLSRFVFDFLFPLLIFTSIVQGFEPGRLGELWPLPLIGFGIAAGGLGIGYFLRFGLKTKDPDMVRTFLFGCVVNNYGYLPIVIVSNLWGKKMLANLFILTLGSTIANWTLGTGVLGSGDIRSMVRNLFSPMLFAIIAGTLVSVAGWDRHLPVIVTHTLESGGSAAVPLMLVLSGASLFKPSAWKFNWPVAYVTVVRLLVLPLCSIALLKLLPISSDVYALSVIVAIMPLAVAQVIFVRVYGGDTGFAASSSLVSTLVSVVTIPLALWFFL